MNLDDQLEKILNDVSSYIKNKEIEKKWIAGKDWVQYAGPYFNSDEYTSSIKSLLNGWLVLGQDAITFETKMKYSIEWYKLTFFNLS